MTTWPRAIFAMAVIGSGLSHAHAQTPAPAPPAPPAPPPAAAPPPAPVTAPPTPVTAPAPATDEPVAEPPATTPANDDAQTESHDDDRDDDGGGKGGKGGKKKMRIDYEPRRGITIRSGKTRVRLFLGIETVMLYGHCSGDSCEATDLASLHVRRARLALEAKLKHHLSIDFAIQVKNEILVLKKATFSWKHDHLTLTAGFLKPPGGLERDSSTWVKPFPERSVVANFKQDRVIGLMASRWVADHKVRLQGAAGRPPAGNFDAFEPEDVVLPPASVEPEDLTTDPGNWDLFATAAYAPSETFEVGLNATTHIAPDAGQGPNFSEPYETRIVQPVFFKGAVVAGGADVSWHGDHVRASAEVVGFRNGETIPHTDAMGNALEPTRAKRGVAGYGVLGFTPNGKYGPAIQNSPLLSGYQLLLRGEFLTVSPGGDGAASSTARFGSVTGGVEWQAEQQLRLQFDLAVQKYNGAVDPSNTNAWRVYAELWGQVLI